MLSAAEAHPYVYTGLSISYVIYILCHLQYPTKYETFDSLSLTLSGGMSLAGTQQVSINFYLVKDHMISFQVSVDTCLRQFVQPEPVKDVLCPLCHRNKV